MDRWDWPGAGWVGFGEWGAVQVACLAIWSNERGQVAATCPHVRPSALRCGAVSSRALPFVRHLRPARHPILDMSPGARSGTRGCVQCVGCIGS